MAPKAAAAATKGSKIVSKAVKPSKGAKGEGKKRSKKRKESYAIYIYKVLKQVHASNTDPVSTPPEIVGRKVFIPIFSKIASKKCR